MKRLTLREARERRGLTQEALAEAIDTRANHISNIETGLIKRPEFETMKKLAEVLGMDAFLSVAGLVFEEKANG